MNNPVRAIVIMIKVMIAVAILLIIAGFTIGCVNKAKAADIKLLKTQHVDYEILFKGLHNEIKKGLWILFNQGRWHQDIIGS